MSQHTQPQQPYAPAQPPGSSPARNGLGISALVLGIIGTVSGLIPFFFWLAGILGLVALILSVVGAVLTFKAVDEAVTDINKAVADSSASAKPAAEGGAAAGGAAGGTEGKDDVLREGDSAAYDDGLEVTVNAPASYTADEFAIGHTKGNKAYTVSVVIENKGKEKYDATLVTVDARAGEDGVNAEQIFDGKVGEGFSGTVLPGKKITATYAFDAPADAKGLTVEVGPGLDWDASQWELKL